MPLTEHKYIPAPTVHRRSMPQNRRVNQELLDYVVESLSLHNAIHNLVYAGEYFSGQLPICPTVMVNRHFQVGIKSIFQLSQSHSPADIRLQQCQHLGTIINHDFSL